MTARKVVDPLRPQSEASSSGLTVDSKKNSVNREQIAVHQKGFTLIELLVVISIIGLIVGITLASYSTSQKKSRDAHRKSDLNNVKKALELAKTDCIGSDYYPAGIGSSGIQAYNLGANSLGSVLTGRGYIKVMPQDTNTTTPYEYWRATSLQINACPNATGSALTGSVTDYRLLATLENTNDSQAAKSQAVCPAVTFAGNQTPTYTATTYAVCPD